MKLLSFSPYYHDSNVTYYDGSKLHYFKSERYTQIKHHKIASQQELDSLLNDVYGVTVEDMDCICICGILNGSPSQLFEEYKRTFETKKTITIDHHRSHALSSELFCNKVDVSFVLDGAGNGRSWVVYKNGELIDVGLHNDCGSIGHGITCLAIKMGINGHGLDKAGKLMGLQSYGKIDLEFLNKLKIYDIKNVGAMCDPPKPPSTDRVFHAGTGLFNYDLWIEHRGDKDQLDWIRTVHERCGEIILELFSQYATPSDTICYSGGVAQNVIWNTRLKEKFPNLHVIPHASDEGLSIGGMIYMLRNFNITASLENFPFCQTDEGTDQVTDEVIARTAQALADGKIVAWYQGHGEIGPRALGHRSILIDPRIIDARERMNRIKHREQYRPFGATVIAEHAKEYFGLEFENPYMLYIGRTTKSDLKSITHVDGTCRVQTTGSNTDSFTRLLTKFYKITGCPVLLNTSLNVAGRPIAGCHQDAKNEFLGKDIDVLVIGNSYFIK